MSDSRFDADMIRTELERGVPALVQARTHSAKMRFTRVPVVGESVFMPGAKGTASEYRIVDGVTHTPSRQPHEPPVTLFVNAMKKSRPRASDLDDVLDNPRYVALAREREAREAAERTNPSAKGTTLNDFKKQRYTVKVRDTDDGVIFEVEGVHAQSWAKVDQDIDGSRWETPRDMPYLAYAMTTAYPGMIAKLRREGYALDTSEYTEPSSAGINALATKKGLMSSPNVAAWDASFREQVRLTARRICNAARVSLGDRDARRLAALLTESDNMGKPVVRDAARANEASDLITMYRQGPSSSEEYADELEENLSAAATPTVRTTRINALATKRTNKGPMKNVNAVRRELLHQGKPWNYSVTRDRRTGRFNELAPGEAPPKSRAPMIAVGVLGAAAIGTALYLGLKGKAAAPKQAAAAAAVGVAPAPAPVPGRAPAPVAGAPTPAPAPYVVPHPVTSAPPPPVVTVPRVPTPAEMAPAAFTSTVSAPTPLTSEPQGPGGFAIQTGDGS